MTEFDVARRFGTQDSVTAHDTDLHASTRMYVAHCGLRVDWRDAVTEPMELQARARCMTCYAHQPRRLYFPAPAPLGAA